MQRKDKKYCWCQAECQQIVSIFSRRRLLKYEFSSPTISDVLNMYT